MVVSSVTAVVVAASVADVEACFAAVVVSSLTVLSVTVTSTIVVSVGGAVEEVVGIDEAAVLLASVVVSPGFKKIYRLMA